MRIKLFPDWVFHKRKKGIFYDKFLFGIKIHSYVRGRVYKDYIDQLRCLCESSTKVQELIKLYEKRALKEHVRMSQYKKDKIGRAHV